MHKNKNKQTNKISKITQKINDRKKIKGGKKSKKWEIG